MNLKEFLSELKRRKVYRVSIAYGIAAWVLAQIVELITDSFEVDPWVMQMIITILMLGFPVTLILSWIFDIGPEGIERTLPKDVNTPTESEPISVKLVIGILVLIILVVIGSNWSIQKFGKGKKGAIHSLAILPFDNFTGTDSLEYFVAGMHSSLIGDMQKISALRVPSKTSSNSFKGTKTSIPEIANQLNVDAALEGEITCMGEDSICVQIRLIRVFPEEEQVWVQDYRIEKREILNFYNKLTKQISKEIDIVLTPKEDRLLAKSRTVHPEAYDAYLKGLYYWEKLDEQSIKKALEYFQLATELDPEWADPYAGLANAWGVFGFFGIFPKSVTLPKVYPYLNKALELDPNSAKAHYVAALLAVWTEWDWEKGEREFLRSIELDPNDALCRMYYAHLLMILRRSNEANQQANIGLELDPMKPLVLGLYGVVEIYNNDDRQAAIQAFEKSLSIDPNFLFSRWNLNEALMDDAYKNGAYEKWIELWNEKVSINWNTDGREAVLKAFHENGHLAAIEEMFRMNDIYGNDCYMSGGVKTERYIKLENNEKAIEALEKDYEIRGNNMPYISPRFSYYDQLKDNPRYVEILRKMNLPLPKN
jgi:adenylate cyclase